MNPIYLKTIIQYLKASDLSDSERREKLKELGVTNEIIAGLLKIKNTNFARQEDPVPLSEKRQAPSLILYTLLFLIALGLITGTFLADQPDWPGLLINLATEITGAVILLLVIDRNYRMDEISELKSKTGDLLTTIKFLFSPDLRLLIKYSKSIGEGIIKIRPDMYVNRPELEEEGLKKLKSGFYLYGQSGSGKTTLLQNIILAQIKKFLNDPKNEVIPVLIPVKHIDGKELLIEIFEEINLFRHTNSNRVKRLIEKGKIILVFDGLYKASNPDELHHQIRAFSFTHQNCPIVISARQEVTEPINNQAVYIPELSTSESMDFIKEELSLDHNDHQ